MAGFTNSTAGIQAQEKQACWKKLVETAKNTQEASDQAEWQTALIFIPSVWDSGLREMPSSASGNQKKYSTIFHFHGLLFDFFILLPVSLSDYLLPTCFIIL